MSLSWTEHRNSCESCPKYKHHIVGTINLICWMKFVCTPSKQKQWLECTFAVLQLPINGLNKDSMHFVLCPKESMYFRNKNRVSRFQITIHEYWSRDHHPPPPLSWGFLQNIHGAKIIFGLERISSHGLMVYASFSLQAHNPRFKSLLSEYMLFFKIIFLFKLFRLIPYSHHWFNFYSCSTFWRYRTEWKKRHSEKKGVSQCISFRGVRE